MCVCVCVCTNLDLIWIVVESHIEITFGTDDEPMGSNAAGTKNTLREWKSERRKKTRGQMFIKQFKAISDNNESTNESTEWKELLLSFV